MDINHAFYFSYGYYFDASSSLQSQVVHAAYNVETFSLSKWSIIFSQDWQMMIPIIKPPYHENDPINVTLL